MSLLGKFGRAVKKVLTPLKPLWWLVAPAVRPILRKRLDDAVDGEKIGGTTGEVVETASDVVIDAGLDKICGPERKK